MGCASSTPMIQTTGSEMLKAATHVATDATKNAEDAVQGVKDTVGNTLETAKDSVAKTVEEVKHEVENVVKEKTEMLEDAKNSLMEKLHLSETSKTVNETATDAATELNANVKADELQQQMVKHDAIDGKMMLPTANSDMEHVLKRTDTETDSLKTSTPEPEIEQALANNKSKVNNSSGGGGGDGNNDDDDDGEDEDDNPPTPKPTLSELENLTAEVLQQQLQQQSTTTPTMVNDISMNNDPLMTTSHDNMKSTIDNNNITSMLDMAIANATKAVESSSSSNTTSTSTNSTTATNSSSTQETISNNKHNSSPPPLFSLPIATTAIVTATAQPRKDTKSIDQVKPKPQQQPPPPQPPHKPKTIKREKKILNGKSINHGNSSQPTAPQSLNEEKRPGTTEWEKFADMLAQHRKYNPHDALKRGGTLTKFGGGGANGHIRPSYIGHHMCGSGGLTDDDSSDTTSNWRGSSHNLQRSSARAGGRIQRPNSANQHKSRHEFSSLNGSNGQKHFATARRNSNAIGGNGRKFDYNPTRSRLINDYISPPPVSSIPYSSLQPALNTPNLPNAPLTYESDKSPSKMRTHHSRNESRTPHHLEPLERPRSRSQQPRAEQQQQHSNHEYLPHSGSSMPFIQNIQTKQTVQYINDQTLLTRESSNTSLFSNSSYVEPHKKSSLDLRPLSTNPPVRNSSSFLTTPRCSPFSVRKSYTDLYFSNNPSSNKENNKNLTTDLSSSMKQRNLRDKSPYKVRDRCEVCCKKYVIK